jgi:hypothetical protein
MHRSQFIPVKRLAGDLIVSQKRSRLGLTLTTREMIFQKPHLSYHFMLEDIIGIMPFKTNLRGEPNHFGGETWTTSRPSGKYYKISASRLVVIHRGGVQERDRTDLVIPLTDSFLEYIRRHTDFTEIAF